MPVFSLFLCNGVTSSGCVAVVADSNTPAMGTVINRSHQWKALPYQAVAEAFVASTTSTYRAAGGSGMEGAAVSLREAERGGLLQPFERTYRFFPQAL